MTVSVQLRATVPADLDFILPLEHRPDNHAFIGRWTREEHLASMARADRQHRVIASATGAPLGYLIAYDVRADGFGIYVKRIAVDERSRGTGRAALAQFAEAARAAGAPFVCLAVRPHNVRAQRCYRAVGYAEWALDDRQRDVFLSRVDPLATDCLIMRQDP